MRFESIAVAAERRGVNRATVTRWCREGQIKCAIVLQPSGGVQFVVQEGAPAPDLKPGRKATSGKE